MESWIPPCIWHGHRVRGTAVWPAETFLSLGSIHGFQRRTHPCGSSHLCRLRPKLCLSPSAWVSWQAFGVGWATLTRWTRRLPSCNPTASSRCPSSSPAAQAHVQQEAGLAAFHRLSAVSAVPFHRRFPPGRVVTRSSVFSALFFSVNNQNHLSCKKKKKASAGDWRELGSR